LLDNHPAVRVVHYPGLESHPGHALAARQQKGFGAMLSVEIDGGVDAVRAFVNGLTCFTLAESLGGVESLVAHPATMTHAAMSAEARAAAGIGDGLLRLSVGIEHVDDLIADLEAALERASAVVATAARVKR
jgi:cystathionine gamma-synthase